MPLTHTAEQGQRLHYLANLGGLVAIAGLDSLEPDLLLGQLLEMAERLPTLETPRVAGLRARGLAKLRARSAENRAWRSRQRALDLHRVDLTTEQIRELIRALGSRPPKDPARLVGALSRVLQNRKAD